MFFFVFCFFFRLQNGVPQEVPLQDRDRLLHLLRQKGRAPVAVQTGSNRSGTRPPHGARTNLHLLMGGGSKTLSRLVIKQLYYLKIIISFSREYRHSYVLYIVHIRSGGTSLFNFFIHILYGYFALLLYDYNSYGDMMPC